MAEATARVAIASRFVGGVCHRRCVPPAKQVPPFPAGTVEGVAKVIGELYSGSELTRVLAEVPLKDDPGEGNTKWRRIAHAVVLTRTGAAVTSRALRNVQEQLQAGGIEMFATTIVERAAFRDLFDYGGTLASLNPASTSNLGKAQTNAREFAGEVVAKLRAAASRVEAA